jgi:hypothetical protein
MSGAVVVERRGMVARRKRRGTAPSPFVYLY